MREIYYIVGAFLVAMGWLPIMLRFFRTWRERKNPVSLAIMALIIFVIYANGITAVLYVTRDTTEWIHIVLGVFNALICINFYFAFRWAERRFKSDRK